MGNPQSDAAQQASAANSMSAARELGLARTVLGGDLSYIQGALGAGEPQYVKQGYKNFTQGLVDTSRASSAADLHAAFSGAGAPQGGQALSTMGRLSAAGAGDQALAVSGSKLAEGQAMFAQTQNLLGAMSGQAVGGLDTAAQQAAQQAGAIAHMRNYNPTYATVLGALSAAGSVYGAYNGAVTSNPDTSSWSMGGGFG